MRAGLAAAAARRPLMERGWACACLPLSTVKSMAASHSPSLHRAQRRNVRPCQVSREGDVGADEQQPKSTAEDWESIPEALNDSEAKDALSSIKQAAERVARSQKATADPNLALLGSIAADARVAPDSAYDWVLEWSGVLRQLPLWAGGLGFLLVLGNRLGAGAAPVIAAGSALSRVDVLCLLMSAILVLTGLTWLSLAPKPPPRAELVGEDVLEVSPELKSDTKAELLWIWRALRATTTVRSIFVFDRKSPILQAGMRRAGASQEALSPGAICQQVVENQKAVYLPNLQLYPGASEFLEYLPAKTQGIIVQPVGEHGTLVAGTDTKRGVGKLDQAWISVIADKLGASLDES